MRCRHVEQVVLDNVQHRWNADFDRVPRLIDHLRLDLLQSAKDVIPLRASEDSHLRHRALRLPSDHFEAEEHLEDFGKKDSNRREVHLADISRPGIPQHKRVDGVLQR